MNFSEYEIIKKYAKQSAQCNQSTLLPYEYERTCILCGFKPIKIKHQLTKIQRKKNKFYQSIKVC